MDNLNKRKWLLKELPRLLVEVSYYKEHYEDLRLETISKEDMNKQEGSFAVI